MSFVAADVTGDGRDDLVVAAGVDQEPAPVFLYVNDGSGRFDPEPRAIGSPARHTGIAVADLDRDGDLDLVVAAKSRERGRGSLRVFRNDHGSLVESTPLGLAAVDFTPMGVSIGDVNADGWPDVAVAVFREKPAEAGPSRTTAPARIFPNRGGTISNMPVWEPALAAKKDGGVAPVEGLSVQFADFNGDGELDLAVGTCGLLVFKGMTRGGRYVLGDANPFAVTAGPTLYLANVPVDAAAWVVAGHNACEGSRTARSGVGAYAVDGRSWSPPTCGLQTEDQPSPVWESSPGCHGGVAVADLTGDGRDDLVVGAWGDRREAGYSGAAIQAFVGIQGGFSSRPWLSRSTAVAEAILAVDLNGSSTVERSETFEVQGERHLVSLRASVVRSVKRVELNGMALPEAEWLWVPGARWVSFVHSLAPKDRVDVTFEVSTAPDLVVADYGEGLRAGRLLVFDSTD